MRSIFAGLAVLALSALAPDPAAAAAKKHAAGGGGLKRLGSGARGD